MTRQPTPANILDAVLTTDATGPDRTALRARLRWDYSQVAPVDRRTVEEAAVDILANGQRVQQVMQNASLAIGERLIAVKRLLQHGQFSDWCDQEFGMSQRTAQNLMNIARTFDGKSAEISFLTDSVLALLAAPSTPEPARQQAIDEAQATGKSPSVQRTKDIIAEHKPARFTLSSDDLPADLVAAGWTVRSKDLGAYWVVNENHGFESAVVRNWDEFRNLRAELLLRLARPSAISNQQSAISNSPTPATPKQFAAAVKSATWTGTQPDILPPSNAPLPAWAEEPISKPGQSTADYLAYRDQANARGEAYLNLKDWRQWLDNGAPVINDDDDLAPRPSPPAPPDDRLQPTQRLRALYQAVIATDDQYGSLTGRFSDTLAVKRDLSAMIGHLEHLIAIIEHPEEVGNE